MQAWPSSFTEGDTLPPLLGETEFSLSGYTVTLKVARPSTTLTKTATITGDKTFSIPWVTGDLVVGQNQVCQISFSSVAGLITAPKFLISVESRL